MTTTHALASIARLAVAAQNKAAKHGIARPQSASPVAPRPPSKPTGHVATPEEIIACGMLRRGEKVVHHRAPSQQTGHRATSEEIVNAAAKARGEI
jgi:hypothetical protein